MPETIGLRGSRTPLRRPPDYPSERPACSEQALAGGGGVWPLGIENEVSESTRLRFSVESWVGVNVSTEKQTEAAGDPRPLGLRRRGRLRSFRADRGQPPLYTLRTHGFGVGQHVRVSGIQPRLLTTE